MATKMAPEELKALSGKGETGSDFENKRANMDYLRNHYEELVKKYPNHWVMISGGRVISAENSPDRFIGKLSKTRERDKVLYYLASPKRRMLL
jgi:thymidylate kinase